MNQIFQPNRIFKQVWHPGPSVRKDILKTILYKKTVPRTFLVVQWVRIHWFHPWSGKILYASKEQLSLCATTTEPGL